LSKKLQTQVERLEKEILVEAAAKDSGGDRWRFLT
jgi:hypothetical protein